MLLQGYKYLLILSTILFFRSANAQSSWDKLQRALKDSQEVASFYRLKQVLKEYPSHVPLLEMKLALKFRLNEYKGLCDDIQKADKIGAALNPYFKYYQQNFCSNEKQKMLKAYQKMFAQRKQTKENEYTTPYTRDDTLRGSLSPFRSCFDVHYYDLEVSIHPKQKSIKGKNGIYFVWKENADSLQIDAERKLNISEVLLDGQKVAYRRYHDVLFLPSNPSWPIGSKHVLTIAYQGKPDEAQNPPWEGGFVWSKNESSKVWAGVACEHLGASIWWPCKDHPSDEPDSMRMSFEVPKPFKVISNGNLIEEIGGGKKHTFIWKVNNPINTYNVTFYIGNFIKMEKDYTDITGAARKLRFYIMPHNLAKADSYFALCGEVMGFYEKAFGPYPFWSDGYSLVESPYEGMEHQSAIAIGPEYGKVKKNGERYATVKDDYLIIHETAHEWWGNSLTAFDMADAWLQEGFATYAEYLFLEDKYGAETFLKEISNLRYRILNFWPLLGNRNVNDNAFIGGDIYDKGALLLQNLRSSINNDSLFFKIIKSFALENRHSIISTETFISHVERLTGKNVTPLFDAYLKQTYIPTLEYSYHHREYDNIITITYKWTNVPDNFVMPFTIKLSSGDFKQLEASTTVRKLELQEAIGFDFVFNDAQFKNCPARYYTYYNTYMKKEEK